MHAKTERYVPGNLLLITFVFQVITGLGEQDRNELLGLGKSEMIFGDF